MSGPEFEGYRLNTRAGEIPAGAHKALWLNKSIVLVFGHQHARSAVWSCEH
jgi:hypothetical protein